MPRVNVMAEVMKVAIALGSRFYALAEASLEEYKPIMIPKSLSPRVLTFSALLSWKLDQGRLPDCDHIWLIFRRWEGRDSET